MQCCCLFASNLANRVWSQTLPISGNDRGHCADG